MSRFVALSALALSALSGCALSCNEMGCSGSLTVFLDRALADGSTVSIDLGDGAMDCVVDTETSLNGCILTDVDGSPAIVASTYMGQAPETASLLIDEGAGAVTYDVTPTWSEPVYPNGEACDGTDGGCRAGEADLAL